MHCSTESIGQPKTGVTTVTDEAQKDTSIRVPSYGGGKFTLENLEPTEVDTLLGAFKGGHHWVRRGDNGRLESVASYEPLPPPAQDEFMLPFWRRINPADGDSMQPSFEFVELDAERNQSPSIFIQHLCGYYYSPRGYERQAELLESYGFACMRSRRDSATGQYWEVWYLPGLWAAKGDLETAIKGCESSFERDKLDAALRFLRVNTSFGSLDVAVQRLAMVIDG